MKAVIRPKADKHRQGRQAKAKRSLGAKGGNTQYSDTNSILRSRYSGTR